MKYILLSITLLAFACDAPPDMPRVDQQKAVVESEEKTEKMPDDAAKATLESYFAALEKREHKALDKMMCYPQLRFYKKEPAPIVHWRLLRREELDTEGADRYDIKPNPIKNDLLMQVRVYALDEYKKTGYEALYFLREAKNEWQFVNRIGNDSVVSVYLKYGENALDFEEYEVLYANEDFYLVKIKPYLFITIDEKARPIDKIVAEREEELIFENNNVSRKNGSLFANLTQTGKFAKKEAEQPAISEPTSPEPTH